MGFPAIARRSVGVIAIGAAALAVAGVGIARATDQNGVVLGGVANHTLKPTGFVNKKGVALALTSKKSKPPLTVNSSKLVKHLNAAQVGGKTASSLETSGSSAVLDPPEGNEVDVSTTPISIASTSKLGAGTYFINASVGGFAPDTNHVDCRLSTTPIPSFDAIAPQAVSVPGIFNLAITRSITVKSGQQVALWCGADTSTSEISYAGLTAIKVDHASTGSTATATPHL